MRRRCLHHLWDMQPGAACSAESRARICRLPDSASMTPALRAQVESYMAYFLPLPAVLSAVRGGPAAGRKTVTATTFLLLGAGSCPSSTDPCGAALRTSA